MSRNPSEAETRQHLINRQLAQAGWSTQQRNLLDEFLLSDTLRQAKESQGTYWVGNEYVDYALVSPDKKPLAIVEAKRSSRDALAGKRQASDYADRIREKHKFEPFIFLCNGETIYFWDRERYPLRIVSGFFTEEDLARLAFQRQYRVPLNQFSASKNIVDRLYQLEAIKRVTESLEQGQRKFLLVMATGTGKTRTVIALVDLLMRAKWIQRVLFLADRRELVRQALGNFKEHIPNETRAWIEGREVDSTARIHVATYPSMMKVFQQLSPGYYDLIIADESHRSIYGRYKALFQHFDALQLGLTATPTDYIDHNTFELFKCLDGLPTFYYPYARAVDEGYLVNYRALEAQTTFQLQGIKAGQLPPELQRQIEEQGIDLSELNFEGGDLERRVTNAGTNDALVKEFMAKCRKDATGSLPAKTIIFAMSHRHAVEIWKSFNRLYPDLQKRGLAEVIDSHMERADRTLDDFKRKNMPRVAISVDMLDTGIDVPAIQNLVFAKPVFSQVKFWQMIGRGTRLWTDPQTGEKKADFLIIDFWNNFAYFNMNPEGEIASPTEPLPVRLFRLRLEKLALLRSQEQTEAIAATITQLQQMLAQLPTDNINVRPHLQELAELATAGAWKSLDEAKVEHLSTAIAPLLRFLPDINLPVMTFDVKIDRLAVTYLAGQVDLLDKQRESITEDLKLLPANLPDIQAQREKLAWMKSAKFWQHLSYDRILDLQTTFDSLMRFRQRPRRDLIELNLPDQIATRRWVIYGPSGEGAFAENYREQVEAHVKTLAEQHPTIQMLIRGENLSDKEIESLAHTLNQSDLFVTEDVLREVYDRPNATLIDFLRHILGLVQITSQEEEISTAFEEFIAAHPGFSAKQIYFLRTMRSAILRRTRLTVHHLQQPPFSRVGAVHRLFEEAELEEILNFSNKFVA
ncbi:type I restriction endonuclease subunit R [Nostoc sp. WHI]|uniref:type I restriction endonuclease subunit R n=1 Tax=Nostoc sp. WHI TaxID=2650611 RepID=UPI0018C6C257|nr:DEAD/DEAH box helicase family protein [Nostoc sp. WHI]MBG1268059.1 DEAD/DEAH box helicase [Nostoc sp. WHI]